MTPTDEIAARYRRYAALEARGSSASYESWARTVAGDPDLLARLAGLTRSQQQPNLVLAAARWCGATPGDAASLRAVLSEQWPRVHAVVSSRTTQTNEVGRCAVLLPLLAALPQPLALLEVGASAGLCLSPDRYSYRFEDAEGRSTTVDPADGPSPVQLSGRVSGPVPPVAAMPEVAWRAGLDLAPLDVTDDDATAWLETLVWPEQHDRRERLRAAIALARRDPPRVVRGDLAADLPALAAEAPPGATLVVFHSAVLAYVRDAEVRRAFADTVAALPGHWVANEGRGVLDLPLPPSVGDPSPETLFTVGFDGRAMALAQPHGRALHWLSG